MEHTAIVCMRVNADVGALGSTPLEGIAEDAQAKMARRASISAYVVGWTVKITMNYE